MCVRWCSTLSVKWLGKHKLVNIHEDVESLKYSSLVREGREADEKRFGFVCVFACECKYGGGCSLGIIDPVK